MNCTQKVLNSITQCSNQRLSALFSVLLFYIFITFLLLSCLSSFRKHDHQYLLTSPSRGDFDLATNSRRML